MACHLYWTTFLAWLGFELPLSFLFFFKLKKIPFDKGTISASAALMYPDGYKYVIVDNGHLRKVGFNEMNDVTIYLNDQHFSEVSIFEYLIFKPFFECYFLCVALEIFHDIWRLSNRQWPFHLRDNWPTQHQKQQ